MVESVSVLLQKSHHIVKHRSSEMNNTKTLKEKKKFAFLRFGRLPNLEE